MKHLSNITIFFFATLLLCFATVSTADSIVLRTEITGIKGAPLSNVQARLAIIQESVATKLSPERISAFYKNAPKNIKQALEPFGYFRSSIASRLTHQGQHWTAHFDIQAGAPLTLSEVDLQLNGPGEEDPELTKFMQHFPIASGQIFQADKYEKAKQTFFQTANNQGYLKAFLEEKIVRIDLQKYTAVIILHFNTGPRYYFGHMTYDQNTFSEKFLNRFKNFQEGQPYSSHQLLKFQEDLNSSQFFREVSVIPDIQQADNYHIPINTKLTANKSQQYNVGIGYGTYTGPRLTMGANLRHLTKTGHHLDFQLKLSPVLSGLAAQYVIPGQNPLTDQYSIGANYQKFSPKNGYSNSKSVSVSHVKTLWGWKRTLSLTYLRENYFVQGQPASRNSRLLMPSLALSRTSADDLLNPRLGYKLDFVVRGASDQVASNTKFVQTDLKGKYIFSPTQLSRVILRGEFGYTAVQDLTLLPLSLQYFAGGLDTVRGFPYSYFGPGRYLKVASAELQHRIYDKWYGAVFYDIGTADNHINAPMGRGEGVGLIYDSLIGPIRAYVGFGHLSGKPRHFDFEFSIGPEL